jgi:hypothetical protein
MRTSTGGSRVSRRTILLSGLDAKTDTKTLYPMWSFILAPPTAFKQRRSGPDRTPANPRWGFGNGGDAAIFALRLTAESSASDATRDRLSAAAFRTPQIEPRHEGEGLLVARRRSRSDRGDLASAEAGRGDCPESGPAVSRRSRPRIACHAGPGRSRCRCVATPAKKTNGAARPRRQCSAETVRRRTTTRSRRWTGRSDS